MFVAVLRLALKLKVSLIKKFLFRNLRYYWYTQSIVTAVSLYVTEVLHSLNSLILGFYLNSEITCFFQ